MNKLTYEQEQAITSRDKNILVSASAGSGKTLVLTKRIVSFIAQGEDLESLLVFTFTKAAAKQMKRRILREIKEQMQKGQEQPVMERLKRARTKISKANISTIHAFCARVLKEQAFIIGLDPRFQVGDENSVAITEQKIIQDYFEKKLDGEHLEFERLYRYLGASLEDLLLKSSITSQARAHLVKASLESDRVLENMQRYFQQKKERILEQMEQARKFAEYPQQLEVIDQDQQMMDSLVLFGRQNIDFARQKAIRGLTAQEKEQTAFFKNARDHYKKRIKSEIGVLVRYSKEEAILRHLENKGFLEYFVHCSYELQERLRSARKNMAKLTFDDLEILVLQLFEEHPQVAAYYREKFHYIFVDEYQDNSTIQDQIISKIKQKNNLFLVGDIKQSIYSFRGANPQLFKQKLEQYGSDENSQQINLNQNFRSTPTILKGINEVFAQVMHRDFGGVNYKEQAMFLAGREQVEEEPLIEFVEIERDLKFTKNEQEFSYIAQRILELHRNGTPYSDIAILLRSPGSSVEEISEIFTQREIPFFIDYSEAYLDQLEVDLMMNFLRVVDNFKRDLPLLSMLRMPVFGFSDNEIVQIRRNHQEGSFYDALVESEKDNEKVQIFFKTLAELRERERTLNMSELIDYIYQKLQMQAYLFRLNNPRQRLANLRLLKEIAREYEETSMVGLHEFLRFVEAVKNRKKDFSQAKLTTDESDVVRIMSIHKAKGLEMPIVFFSQLSKRYNERDLSQSIVIQGDRLAMHYYLEEERLLGESLYRNILISESKTSLREEGLRLLYVAMSRAENKLVLTSCIDEKEKNSWEHPVVSIAEAKSFYEVFAYANAQLPKRQDSFNFINIKREEIRWIPEGVAQEEQKVDWMNPPVEADYFVRKPVRLKKSVTSLSKKEEVTELQDFNKNVDLYQKGTSFHKVMEFIDFDLADRCGVEYAIKQLEKDHLIQAYDEVELVKHTFDTFICQYYKKAGYQLRRELPFVESKEQGLIQGIIDLVIETKEGVILVDYKTDHNQRYLNNYAQQIEHYANAYERITRQKVIKKGIYFVRSGKWEEC